MQVLKQLPLIIKIIYRIAINMKHVLEVCMYFPDTSDFICDFYSTQN